MVAFFATGSHMEYHMSGTSKPETPEAEEPHVPAPLPELPDLDPVPDDGSPADHKGPAPEDVPFVPPPGTQ